MTTIVLGYVNSHLLVHFGSVYALPGNYNCGTARSHGRRVTNHYNSDNF